MEAYALTVLSCGLSIAVLSWIWLLVRAFQQRSWWGVIGVVFPPVALLFARRHPQRAISPLAFFALGSMIAAAPVAYSLVGPADLGLRAELRQEPRFLSLAKNAVQSDAAHEWMEQRAFYMQLGGVAFAALAWIWLLVRAFRQNRRWGVSSLIIPPVGLIFAGCYPRKGGIPLGLVLVCLLVAATPAVYTLYVPLNLGAARRLSTASSI